MLVKCDSQTPALSSWFCFLIQNQQLFRRRASLRVFSKEIISRVPGPRRQQLVWPGVPRVSPAKPTQCTLLLLSSGFFILFITSCDPQHMRVDSEHMCQLFSDSSPAKSRLWNSCWCHGSEGSDVQLRNQINIVRINTAQTCYIFVRFNFISITLLGIELTNQILRKYVGIVFSVTCTLGESKLTQMVAVQ